LAKEPAFAREVAGELELAAHIGQDLLHRLPLGVEGPQRREPGVEQVLEKREVDRLLEGK
jgi:hypothetical protein